MCLKDFLSPVEPDECSGAGSIGFHEWKVDSLIPEHWASESVEPTKERALCRFCGATTDDLSVLHVECSGPLGPSYTGF